MVIYISFHRISAKYKVFLINSHKNFIKNYFSFLSFSLSLSRLKKGGISLLQREQLSLHFNLQSTLHFPDYSIHIRIITIFNGFLTILGILIKEAFVNIWIEVTISLQGKLK